MNSPQTVQIAVLLLIFLTVGAIALTIFLPAIVGSRKSEKRLEQVTASRNPSDRKAAADEKRRKRSVEETLKEIEEQQKLRLNKSAKPSLTMRMRQAGLSWTKNTYIVISILAGLFSFGVAVFAGGAKLLPAIGFMLAGGLLLPHLYVTYKRRSQFKKFLNEFPNAVDVIVRGVKAGLPLIDCMKVIASDAQEPVRSEFREIIEDQTLGLPMDEAVSRLVERIPLPEANFFAIVISIQSRSGGSLSEALGNLSKVLRDRKKMEAKIRAMSAEAKSSAGIIAALPVVVTVLVYFSTPAYILRLFETTTGNWVLMGCGVWMLMGVLVMRKMINFDF